MHMGWRMQLFSKHSHCGDLNFLYDGLPPRMRAMSSCRAYFYNFEWLIGGITEAELSAMLNTLYPNNVGAARRGSLTDHELAVVFAVLSMAALLDPAQEPQRTLAKFYFDHATIALGTAFEHPTMHAVCAMVSIRRYWTKTDKQRSARSVGTSSLATTLGTHPLYISYKG